MNETLVGLVSGEAPEVVADGNARIGRYLLQGLLGAGGMGAVYRALDIELDEVVALKLVRPEFSSRPAMIQRFRQEVRLARRILHPNVVRVYDLGSDGERRFLTMELVQGRSLGAVLEEEGPLPISEIVRVGRAVCGGLAAAHAAGVVHRDIKPDNLLLGADRVVITDFGIAVEGGSGVAGTPEYMAPEQVEGRPVDPRADLYALGVTLFELATGRRPWTGGTPVEVARARLGRLPPNPRVHRTDLPTELARIILQCMAEDPEERFDSALALEAALAALGLDGGPSRLRAESEKVLVVCPFTDAFDGQMGAGVAEELVDRLCRDPSLRLRVGEPQPGVAVLSGELLQVEGGARLVARLEQDGFRFWAGHADGKDPREAVDRLAAAVAGALLVRADTAPSRPTVDPMALELHLRGRAELRRGWNAPERAIAVLEQAKALAPDDNSIRLALITARARQGLWGDGEILANAERELAALGEHPEALVALGILHLNLMQIEKAGGFFGRAAELGPGLVRTQESLGALLSEVGVPAARRHLQRALDMDPTALPPRVDLARLHALAGNWDRVWELAYPPVQADPERALFLLLRARLEAWLDTPRMDWLDEARRIVRAHPEFGLSRALTMFIGWHADKRLPTGDIGGSPRLRAITLQSHTELYCAAGRLDEAETLLRATVAAGVFDRPWMYLCPATAPLRERAVWRELRGVVDARADAVRRAAGVEP